MAQTRLLRLLNNPRVMKDETLDASACWALWRQLLEDDRFQFAADEPRGLDAAFERFSNRPDFTPRLWTDAYFAAFAYAGGLTLVTFDLGFREFSELAYLVLGHTP